MNKPSPAKRLLHNLLLLDLPAGHVQGEAFPVPLKGLPSAFHLARVVVVSDVHLPDALMSIDRLVRCVALQKPDAIFLLGDLTNSYTDFDTRGLRELARKLVAVAPCFAIPGNHELRLEREPLYRHILTACGVHYMCDSYADWVKDGQTLRLFGMGRQCPRPLAVEGQPSVVLAHKPNYMRYYRHAGWELVLCGHAHGGQIRLGNRGLFAPDQGFFPRYVSGAYTEGNTTMVVSRGLGNSSVPWRIGNDVHLPVILLLSER